MSKHSRIIRDMEKKKQTINEVVDINGSKVFVENGEVKTIFNEDIQRTGYMRVEVAKQLTLEKIKKIYQLNNLRNGNETRQTDG